MSKREKSYETDREFVLQAQVETRDQDQEVDIEDNEVYPWLALIAKRI